MYPKSPHRHAGLANRHSQDRDIPFQSPTTSGINDHTPRQISPDHQAHSNGCCDNLSSPLILQVLFQHHPSVPVSSASFWYLPCPLSKVLIEPLFNKGFSSIWHT